MRSKESIYSELELDHPELTEDALIDAMLAHPILINRPIVITQKGTRLCRPPELVLEILP
jgi:arsenate reductase